MREGLENKDGAKMSTTPQHLRAHFKTWYDRWIVSGKRMVFGSGSFVPALRSSAPDTQAEVLKCALKTLEVTERESLPGPVNVLREEGLEAVRHFLWDVTGWHRDQRPVPVAQPRDRGAQEGRLGDVGELVTFGPELRRWALPRGLMNENLRLATVFRKHANEASDR